MNQDLILYYKERAKEYEKIYAKPERQSDLISSIDILRNLFCEKDILEIACGTGFWTEKIARTAKSIHATDVNEAVIEIARQKNLGNKVRFEVADLYNLDTKQRYEGLFGGFIWSHILLQDLNSFVEIINQTMVKNGFMVFMDNKFVEGSSIPIASTDQFGNTYQLRKLENGTSHSVLKNFPTQDLIFEKLSVIAFDINFINLEYYWIVSCKIK
ncbi:Methyltransferase domain-containing protein [Pedobacter westerhofensis]|uniref:Methyltransferase domain-containing protein n=1 Tax=Pedobacter westerhofensis TaxID=425512 RepID=A0A521FUI5_9SPHI|nr:class I SAM-dependent methyltransferase [Pedobacter westerhofensis]SMO99838.1 Methyltransferase domain-containing protein [Pedobacter westerhofensis]